MAMSLISCSEEEFYYKLDNILLSSCEYLRKHFREKWKSETGEDWKDDNDYKAKFLNEAGKIVFKRAKSFQKNAFKDRSIDDWDLPLLSLLIQNIGDVKICHQQNEAISQLKTLRNEVAHHSTRKISSDDYFEKVCVFKESMLKLGMSNQDIEMIINQAGSSSSKKAKNVINKQLAKAKAFLESKQFDKAMEYFNDAIAIPSLLPKHLGKAYEERANCLLSMVKDHNLDQDKISSALLDSSKALDLNEYSWNAHYLTAQCYRWQSKLSEAIMHFEKALSISPGQTKVKEELYSCKNLFFMHQRQEHLNPTLVMNFQERVAHFNNETGWNMTEDFFLEMCQSKLGNAFAKGQPDVFRGHQYFRGWNVPQDFKKAAKYYTKASNVGNLEGMYNLAMCYQHGNGVRQDISKALEMFRELAEMDESTTGQRTQTNCNVGVAGAQHTLGLLYYDGIGVEQNRKEAAVWYQRAMENGVGHAANNLGVMYEEGDGVEHNSKMAEMCWKQAINLKDANAPKWLMDYYIKQLEPDLALGMAKTGRQMQNSAMIIMTDAQLNNTLNLIRNIRARQEPKVLKFEKEHNLSTKGLTFRERLTRVNEYVHPAMETWFRVANNLLNDVESGDWGGKAHPLNWLTILSIEERATAGSRHAAKIIKTLVENKILVELLDENESYTDPQKFAIIDSLYVCATKEYHLVILGKRFRQKLESIVAEMFEKYCNKRSADDEKIRFCYVAFNLRNSASSKDMYGVEVLKEGVRRYPDNLYYYDLLSCSLGLKKHVIDAILYTEKGLEKFPDNEDLQYYLAVHLRLKLEESHEKSDVLKAISEYEKFLSMAAMDHRKYPEAYYLISNLYLYLYCMERNFDQKYFSLARQFFMYGEEVEIYQLDCYLPYAESNVKNLTEAMLEAILILNPIAATERSEFVEVPLGVLEQKPYLLSPVRKAMIRQHRKFLEMKLETENTSNLFSATRIPKLVQQTAVKMSQLRQITLQEMNPTQDHVFYNRFLELTIIEDPNPHFMSIHLIAEDANGDTTRLYLYNIEKTTTNLNKVRAGSRLAILNPYMRIGTQDITPGIRNDAPKCLIYLNQLVDMCRFCGIENAQHKCSKCNRPYCSRECQLLDWKEFKHKLICKICN